MGKAGERVSNRDDCGKKGLRARNGRYLLGTLESRSRPGEQTAEAWRSRRSSSGGSAAALNSSPWL